LPPWRWLWSRHWSHNSRHFRDAKPRPPAHASSVSNHSFATSGRSTRSCLIPWLECRSCTNTHHLALPCIMWTALDSFLEPSLLVSSYLRSLHN
jgi:hypothetical protein